MQFRGRVRLRVPALKTSPGLAEPLQRLLRDQPGVTEVTVNDWCFSVTVTCDPVHLDGRQALRVAATTQGDRGRIVQICE